MKIHEDHGLDQLGLPQLTTTDGAAEATGMGSDSPGGWKPKNKGQLIHFPGEDLLPGFWLASFSPCPHTSEREMQQAPCSFFLEITNPTGRATP